MTLLDFILQHPYLWIAAAVIILLLLLLEFETVWRGIKSYSPSELTIWMNRGAVVIDVNETTEFSKGHILGSIHAPFSQISQRTGHLDKSKLTIVVSNEERQAVQVAKTLQQQGFKELGILTGGLPAWKGANLPLVRK